MADDDFILNRDFLMGGGLDAMLKRLVLDVPVWTDAQRAESLAAILAARPLGPVWLFCYGSLIWNPMIEVASRRRATIAGRHRAFCLSSPGGRGTPENPGLLLGLDHGGSCTGIALEIPEAHVNEDLALIWRREMVTAAYIPLWLHANDDSGAPFPVLTFTMNTDYPHYVRLDDAEAARRLATARGEIGSSADYLFRTRAALARNGITDPLLERLAARVTALQEAGSAPGP
jgi:cation transport protein ChaC